MMIRITHAYYIVLQKQNTSLIYYHQSTTIHAYIIQNKSILTLRILTNILRRGGRQERIFVALFDYDPPTMSPNPEACDEELPFREGQLIKVRNVINDSDSDVIAKIAFLNKVETEQFCAQKMLFLVSFTLGGFLFFFLSKSSKVQKFLCHPDLN